MASSFQMGATQRFRSAGPEDVLYPRATVRPCAGLGKETIEVNARQAASGDPSLGTFRRGELVLNTMAPYMTVIGIAGERWNASVARNCRSRCLPLTTDVLALEDERL